MSDEIQRHASISIDELQREAFVSSVARFLLDRDDGQYWRSRARQRIELLEADKPVCGLVPHEERELKRLRELLTIAGAATNENELPVASCVGDD